jgi:asparagine synthase (glutamine-hydrolysing)
MCGLNGILRLDPSAEPVSPEAALRTRDRMTSRGPDGAGLWCASSGSVVLGHRRLAILDPSDAGHEPMGWQNGRYQMVYNGEIYNFRELREELVRGGEPLRSHADAEVLLALYAKEGTKGLARLRGMFAFAIWDDRERTLVLARDPNGIKPLYYTSDGRHLRFASQARALAESVRTSPDVEPGGLAGFLVWGSVPEPQTFWRGIQAVPAGCMLEAREGSRHWALAPLPKATAPGAPSAVEAIRGSVAAHLVSDVPVGVFLSGGLDSSLIAALAGKALGRPLTAVTLRFSEFEGGLSDEAPAAREIAARLGMPHTERVVTRQEFMTEWPAILDRMDQPTIDGPNTYLVAKAARELGLKAMLSGLGGDEVMGSYPSFRDVPRWRRWTSALSRLPGLVGVWPHLARRLAPARPKLGGLMAYGGTIAGAYLLRRALFLPDELSALLGPDLARESLCAYAPLDDALKASMDEPDPWRAVATLETSLYLRNQLLRDCDWASMAHSVEVRVPFVDAWLQEQLATLAHEPARSRGKAALLREAAPEIPEAVLRRPKTGFSVPTCAWLDFHAAQEPHGGRCARRLALDVLRHFGVTVRAVGAVA